MMKIFIEGDIDEQDKLTEDEFQRLLLFLMELGMSNVRVKEEE